MGKTRLKCEPDHDKPATKDRQLNSHHRLLQHWGHDSIGCGSRATRNPLTRRGSRATHNPLTRRGSRATRDPPIPYTVSFCIIKASGLMPSIVRSNLYCSSVMLSTTRRYSRRLSLRLIAFVIWGNRITWSRILAFSWIGRFLSPSSRSFSSK